MICEEDVRSEWDKSQKLFCTFKAGALFRQDSCGMTSQFLGPPCHSVRNLVANDL